MLGVGGSKTDKQSLENLSKRSAGDIRCWYMWDFVSLPKCSSILVVKRRQFWLTQPVLQLAAQTSL